MVGRPGKAKAPGWALGCSLLMLVSCLGACRPESNGRPSRIDSPRVLAIRSSPAEARPEAPVTWEALFVGADSDPDPTDLGWAMCLIPKPITEPGPVELACLSPSDSSLAQLGFGATVSGLIPKDACRVFGPSPPDPEPGKPSLRPVDPDTTGGYYLPVRLLLPSSKNPEYAVGVTRLSCGLVGATQEQAADFSRRDRPNENPSILAVVARRANGQEQAFRAGEVSGDLVVGPAETVEFRVTWETCTTDTVCGDGICGPEETKESCLGDCSQPRGCSGAEHYVAFDPVTRKLVERRESVRLSWFASGGDFEHDRTGRSENEASVSSTENSWTAPDSSGAVRMWLVIRDDRGGVGWLGLHGRVEN